MSADKAVDIATDLRFLLGLVQGSLAGVALANALGLLFTVRHEPLWLTGLRLCLIAICALVALAAGRRGQMYRGLSVKVGYPLGIHITKENR